MNHKELNTNEPLPDLDEWVTKQEEHLRTIREHLKLNKPQLPIEISQPLLAILERAEEIVVQYEPEHYNEVNYVNTI